MKKDTYLYSLFILFNILCLMNSCTPKNRTLQVDFLKEGQLETETVPLDFFDENGEIISPYINSVTFAKLDSVSFKNNHPDYMERHLTILPLDFKKEIEKYSPEYYAIYTVYNIHKTIDYYNNLFDNKIDFNSQKDYRDIEIIFGDIPILTSPKAYIFDGKPNPSPSLFFHEIGHRAFWLLEDSLDIKFKGLSYVHMGLLEYFTVSLNNSPVVGEDALPSKGLRNASWSYGYPIADSLNIGSLLTIIKESYPEKMKDTTSNTYKYFQAATDTYKDYPDKIDNHRGGMIITSTLWRIREALGQDITDKLISQTILNLNEYMEQRPIFYKAEENEELPDKIEWYDLYYGLLQKDKELKTNGRELIKGSFKKTGFPVDKVGI